MIWSIARVDFIQALTQLCKRVSPREPCLGSAEIPLERLIISLAQVPLSLPSSTRHETRGRGGNEVQEMAARAYVLTSTISFLSNEFFWFFFQAFYTTMRSLSCVAGFQPW